MIARPPNCTSVPCQMNGTRFQPSSDRWVSERKPIKARNGAKISGSEIMMATSEAGTSSSTIMTRLRVPISSTKAMPTETWNSDKRSSRLSGNSAVAASANGMKRGPNATHELMTFRLILFIGTRAVESQGSGS